MSVFHAFKRSSSRAIASVARGVGNTSIADRCAIASARCDRDRARFWVGVASTRDSIPCDARVRECECDVRYKWNEKRIVRRASARARAMARARCDGPRSIRHGEV